MTLLPFLPILIPLAFALGALLMPAKSRIIGIVGSAALLIAAVLLLRHVSARGILVAQVGNWPAPFGVTLVIDNLSAIMVMLAGVMALMVSIYAYRAVDPARHRFGFFPLFFFLLMGVCGAFTTGDLFNMYVWFEVLLISSFVLLALGGERPQLEGAVKYVTLNLLSSTFFLIALALIYGKLGTLNIADLAVKAAQMPNDTPLKIAALLLLAAFGVKAAVFPLYFWLPASYHTPPAAVSTLFAGLMTKVGVYALIRTFTLIFIHDRGQTHNILLILASLTMFFGVIGAAVQFDFRRILAFHSISQIGYMIMGLALFTPLALAGAVFFMVHHTLVKSNLFLISGAVAHVRGTFDLKKLGGLYPSQPLLALLFIIAAFSLAGLPPLTGFWAKFFLVKAGLQSEAYLTVLAALVVSLLTLYSMTKIWAEAFWKDDPQPQVPSAPNLLSMTLPVALMTALILLFSFAAEPLVQLTLKTAAQLLDPQIYIQAVLGE